jgi:hypothetical protein
MSDVRPIDVVFVFSHRQGGLCEARARPSRLADWMADSDGGKESDKLS